MLADAGGSESLFHASYAFTLCTCTFTHVQSPHALCTWSRVCPCTKVQTPPNRSRSSNVFAEQFANVKFWNQMGRSPMDIYNTLGEAYSQKSSNVLDIRGMAGQRWKTINTVGSQSLPAFWPKQLRFSYHTHLSSPHLAIVTSVSQHCMPTSELLAF